MLDIYGTLEISKVLEEISSFSNTELGKKKILSLRMLEKDEAIKSLKLVDEMSSFILRYGSLPIASSFDLVKYIETAKKGGILTPAELDHIAHDILTAKKISDFFRKAEKSLYFSLIQVVNKLYDISHLELRIHSVIAPNLSIKDDASLALSKIRNAIHKQEFEVRRIAGALIKHYSEYLTEQTITIRNDHFVLPVDTANKSKVPGIIHDISDSGQTTFIEPMNLVQMSNELCSLKVEEKEEIYRLLKELTLLVEHSSNEINCNNNVIGELDFIAAKAMYGNKHNCLVANISDDKVIELVGARHPLINEDKVVANDFTFNKEQRIIVISGPNAGGKTVALKTLGLMVMMSQMGIAIPTKEPGNLAYFPRIYADIGDNQSLSDNLSTFAAHVSNLSTITHFVTHKDLVLLDELGTGTSPNEGEALALAVSDFLLNKNCFALISSHFERMKEYAYRREGVSNAMMVFDDKKLFPTYSLKIGFPGRSYGLEMAIRYHLDKEVIESAKKNLSKTSNRSISDVLDKLNNVLHENEQLNKKLKEDKRLLEGKTKDINYQNEVLQSKKENLLSDVEETKQEMIAKAKKEIDDALKVMNNPHAKTHELIEAKTKLSKMAEGNETFEAEDDEINLNDYVEVAELSLIGKVVKINKDKVEIITTDGMSVKSTLNKLRKVSVVPEAKKRSKQNVDDLVMGKSQVKLELNLIGKHIDEAIPELAKYLDDCLLRHFKEVRIIHGMGTGALRQAVRDYLDTCSFVESYRYGESFEGATGATVVILK
ncbi:MAG: endonuclease MutS2 [Firmicutes bacterium]|nr:endonuclease MutS2 [Candidatus Fiminaster equi]